MSLRARVMGRRGGRALALIDRRAYPQLTPYRRHDGVLLRLPKPRRCGTRGQVTMQAGVAHAEWLSVRQPSGQVLLIA
jgi:hypothetical protein